MRSLRPIFSLPLRRSAHLAVNYIREVIGVETSRRWFGDHTGSRNPAELAHEIEKIRIDFEDVQLSILDIPPALRSMPAMKPEDIYVNKNLRLDSIQVYGFDYDYTLAHYSKNLQSLTYDLAKEFLVSELKYPKSCLQFEYDPYFPVRGLYFDRRNGCLMKLDFFGSIEPDSCFLGRQKLSREEIIKTYGSRHIGREQARELISLMDFFCFSEVCLLADVVQHFIDARLDYDASYVYDDVKHAIQHVHGSGVLHRTILSDPEKYLMKNDKVLKFLTKLKEKGKKIFLLTNSPYYFVNGGMRFLLQDGGIYRDSWRDLFDVVIVRANKPTFYTSEHPFRYYDIEKDTVTFRAVDRFIPGQVYYYGCLKSFRQITKWNGPEVIYFGDHLFSDLSGPSKAGWRTVAIIHELENEIRVQNTDDYRFQQAKFHIVQELLGKFILMVSKFGERACDYPLLEELNEERSRCRCKMRNMFNPSFGPTFLTDCGYESGFAYHLHNYADVYTSKPENFLDYPFDAWLHVPSDIKILSHHVKVSSSFLKEKYDCEPKEPKK
ncbi:5'-nucleotidase domain-containing protein DDB_G0275467 [Phalaenopsis equestris]|uniref:5'-nucleotidase domain-containing protein DDB_G0275467 n=1 Tax=Phalaenopsis equestris TaxID=78828 RepID=UPI0009E5E2CE|nr:5'-nucleotidase domain-containing protein DDB_G0275467 [Phalaenopsis equestris]